MLQYSCNYFSLRYIVTEKVSTLTHPYRCCYHQVDVNAVLFCLYHKQDCDWFIPEKWVPRNAISVTHQINYLPHSN